MKNKKFLIVNHEHRHGTTTLLFSLSKEALTKLNSDSKVFVVSILEEEFEEDRGETLDWILLDEEEIITL